MWHFQGFYFNFFNVLVLNNIKTSMSILSVIYIERSDFKLEGDKNFRRLTKDQSVGLRHAGFVISFTKIVRKDELGNITEIEAECCTVEKASCFQTTFAFVFLINDNIIFDKEILFFRLTKSPKPLYIGCPIQSR